MHKKKRNRQVGKKNKNLKSQNTMKKNKLGQITLYAQFV